MVLNSFSNLILKLGDILPVICRPFQTSIHNIPFGREFLTDSPLSVERYCFDELNGIAGYCIHGCNY